MSAKRSSALSTLLLGASGIALSLVAFLVILSPAHRTSVAWLDLIVIDVVVFANVGRFLVSSLRTQDFSREIPKIAILWNVHVTYTALALGGVWGLGSIAVPFVFQLLYHACVFFGFLVFYAVAEKASEHAQQVTTSERKLDQSLQTLKRSIAECDAAFIRLGDGRSPEYLEFQQLKEQVRYLSPSDSPNAISLDLEISLLLENLASTLSTSTAADLNSQPVKETLTRCGGLVKLRKQERRLGQGINL